jgi:site-specific recombinase XerD
MNDLVLHVDAAVARIKDLLEQAEAYARQSRADNTLTAYNYDWRDFSCWCQRHGCQALPATPETVAAYLTDLAQRLKPSTLERRISAISVAHQAAEVDNPTRSLKIRLTMEGFRRELGTAQEAKEPATLEVLRLMLAELPEGLLGVRDRALLLVGFAGAFRRSELVGLDVEDIAFVTDGMVVTLRRSKTDQEGQGRKLGIPYGSSRETCPVRALRAWLEASQIASGPIFRPVDRHANVRPTRLSGKAVALVVKRYVAAAGFDPEGYAGHSLRAGLATSAAAAGVSERAIMQQTGHKSERMVRKYIREGSLFRDNAAGKVGL